MLGAEVRVGGGALLVLGPTPAMPSSQAWNCIPLPPPLHFLARLHLLKDHGPSWNLLPLGEGLCCLLLGTQVPPGT